ncbi:hydrolase [Actinoplanes ianthinogenes]|uniref:Hydrolase n=1 Tax=Actinoplanes ianthinogenes TaxID=122358 RepID=A0ABM7M6M6_9ACTN|nr:hydrolase [Actinoplanes ianthinogenes]GGR42598.1 hydrolase [Actinoplanes ianthinogenes]
MHGDGLPIVLIHAGVADRRMWDPQWERLAADHHVVRLDLHGFGESATPPDGPVSHPGDVRETLAHLGVERCHLVGASFGAGVAVEVALTAPDLVASLLLCPPGGSLLAARTDDFAAFAEAENSALAAGDLDAAVEANIAAWVVGPTRDPAEVGHDVQDAVRRMQRQVFDIQENWPAAPDEVELDPPALQRLASVTVPVLLLVGAHDLATTHDAAERLCAGLPDVRRVDWPDVAHLPSLERPDRFHELLLDWIAD